MSTLTHTPHRITLLASAAMALCFSAQAAGPTVDAGSLLRQTEQQIKTPKAKPARKARKPTPKPATSPTDTTVNVRQFKFAGNTLLIADSNGLQFLIKDSTQLDKVSKKLLDRFR